MFKAIIEAYDVGWEARRTASHFYVDFVVEDIEAVMVESGCEIVQNDGDVTEIINAFITRSWVG